MQDKQTLPIGVFDSGLGGLTVLKELTQQLPSENFLYLGDTARLPYGSKSPKTIRRYTEQNAEFLLKTGVKAIVVACNSASSTVMEGINLSVPVFNVIQPGAQMAYRSSSSKRIGVIATQATVHQQAYIKALRDIDKQVEVYQQACPLLVPLVEEGWETDPLTNLVVYRYLSQILQHGIDTLILGCTHYPALKPNIERVVGANIKIVDSAQAVTEQIQIALAQGDIALNQQNQRGRIDILTTDQPSGFQVVAERLLRPFDFHSLKQVDL